MVAEVVAFDAGNRQRTLRLGETVDYQRVRAQGRGAALPGRPGLGRVHLGDLVVADQAFVERSEQVVALVQRDRRDVVLPVIGEQAAGAGLVEPFDFLRTAEKDPAQDQAVYPLRMGLRVGQREGRTPGAAKQHPFVDAQVLSNPLQVGDQIPGGVVFQAGVRRGATAAALIESDNAIEIRIEEATTLGITSGTGAAVDEHHRQTFR
ncbi:hypothetical protein D3C72_1016320 [compost metagenome]